MKIKSRNKIRILIFTVLILTFVSIETFAEEIIRLPKSTKTNLQSSTEVNLANKSITNKSELKNYLFTALESRPNKIKVKYYGRDIENNDEAIKVMESVQENIGYHQANIHKLWTQVSHSEWTQGNHKEEWIEISYRMEYQTTDEEEEFIDAEVEKIVKTYIKPNMSELEKVRILHDYLVNNTNYTKITKGSEYTAYTVLKEKAGVCNGYVLAFIKLMNAVNVDVLYVYGIGQDINGLHAWNKVKIDDVWYNIDVTWAKPSSKHGLHHNYRHFLNSDDRFYKTHTPSSYENLPSSFDTRYEGKYDDNFTRVEFGANFD